MGHLLIVEDEAVLRLTFTEFLVNEGHTVVTASDYIEAMAAIHKEDFDLVITDIILGGKTGIDLLRTIRAEGHDWPVVMVTGEPNVETASEAVRLGAFDYLAKPVKKEALLRVSRLATAHKQLSDERNMLARRMDSYRRELEGIFNSVNEGIVTVDEFKVVRQINPAARRILSHLDMTTNGKDIETLLPGPFTPARIALMETLANKKQSPEVQLTFSTPTEPENAIIANTMPLLDEGGAFHGALLLLRDVSNITRLEKQLAGAQQFRNIIGKNRRMQEIFVLIKELSDTNSTVLIGGESGTGKELIAAAIHQESTRATKPFVRVNCAALAEDILESELFGHVKGAFTGAIRDRIGRFEAAHGGTILLDEIGDVSPRLQLRLLRVLQEGEFERVGDSASIHCDVRVIASTNQDLRRKIQSGEFRQDLYYRLNVVRIDLPPLRQRREDIPLLVEHFRSYFNRSLKRHVSAGGEQVMELFMRYSWPGNIRELENTIERSMIVCREQCIQMKHLPQELQEFRGSSVREVSTTDSTGAHATSERERIVDVLGRTDWNVAKAARMLNMARNTLYQKMRAMNISRPDGLELTD